MSAVQRLGALRVASSYHTVSEPAIMVIAGIVPIDIMASERQFLYQRKRTADRNVLNKIAREQSRTKWQNRWETDDRGRWTYRLIKNLNS